MTMTMSIEDKSRLLLFRCHCLGRFLTKLIIDIYIFSFSFSSCVFFKL